MEFLRFQISTDRTSGTRTRATQMLNFKFGEICSMPITTAPRGLLPDQGAISKGATTRSGSNIQGGYYPIMEQYPRGLLPDQGAISKGATPDQGAISKGATTRSGNNIRFKLRSCETISKFKQKLLSLIRPPKKSIFGIHDPHGIKILFQLRVGLNHNV